VSVGRQTGR